MMGSPVIVVPALAEVPDDALANVCVFTNGVRATGPAGPLGYQRDVFDSVPGDAAYRPLRRVNLVTWNPDATPEVLGSAAEIDAAASAGNVSIERSGIVVNMPLLSWPGGSR